MVKLFKERLVVSKEERRDGWYSRGYFPHFDGEGATQHVCFGLFDSLPQHVLQRWREELKQLAEKEGDVEWRRRIQDFLDSGYGSCFLRDGRLAEIVQNALLYFDGQRYALHAWCVMPNHVHVLFTPEAGFKMSAITHSWKSFTANQCNKLLERTGSFWQKEPFDRHIRNERHYQTRWLTLKTIRSKRACAKGRKIGSGAAQGGVSNLGTHRFQRARLAKEIAVINERSAECARWKRCVPRRRRSRDDDSLRHSTWSLRNPLAPGRGREA